MDGSQLDAERRLCDLQKLVDSRTWVHNNRIWNEIYNEYRDLMKLGVDGRNFGSGEFWMNVSDLNELIPILDENFPPVKRKRLPMGVLADAVVRWAGEDRVTYKERTGRNFDEDFRHKRQYGQAILKMESEAEAMGTTFDIVKARVEISYMAEHRKLASFLDKSKLRKSKKLKTMMNEDEKSLW